MRWAIPVLGLLLAACGGGAGMDDGVVNNPRDGIWQHRDPPPVRLVLEQTYGSEEGEEHELLAGPRSAAVGPDGTLYLMDSDYLKSFAPDGSLNWAIGGEGEGPGEFYRTRGIAARSDGQVFVANLSGNRLDRFSGSGEYVGALTLATVDVQNATLVGLLDDTTAVLSRYLPARYGNRFYTVEVGASPALVDSVSTDFTGDRVLQGIAVGGESGVVHGRIVTSTITEYRFRFFDRKLQYVLDVKREGTAFTEPYLADLNGNQGLMVMGTFVNPMPLADGRWLGGGSWQAPGMALEDFAQLRFSGENPQVPTEGSIDLFDSGGTLLYSLDREVHRAAGVRSVLATDGHERIYARTMDPTPRIGRYRMEIDA